MSIKKLYRILLSPDAPSVELSSAGLSSTHELHGQSLMGLVPDDHTFRGQLSRHAEWNTFYRGLPGSFAVSEEAWDHCMNLYYVLEYGGVEIPFILTEHCSLRLINPVEVIPEITLHALNNANVLFRIRGEEETAIFCLEGTDCPGDEFKYIYERFGFNGLEFKEVWTSS
jgi:hypothetical protein